MKSIDHPDSGSTDSENHLLGHGVLENQIQALSWTMSVCLFSKTFQTLKIWKKWQAVDCMHLASSE